MLTRPGERFRRRDVRQVLVALIGGGTLEAFFLYLRHLVNLETYVVETIAVGLGAGVVYLLLLFVLERAPDSRAGLWLVVTSAVVFRLTLAPLTPTLSEDIYRYEWDGRVQLAGQNPYALKPDDPRIASLRRASKHHFPGGDIPTIYPPLAELIFRTAVRWLGGPPRLKLPMIAADFAVLFMLAAWLRSAGGRNYQLAIYGWNPLVVVEFAGNSHSDALALAALVAAFVIIRSRRSLSTLALAAAALIKTFPVLLLPVWLRRNGWPRSVRSWMEGAGAAALALVCWWPFRSAWKQLPATGAYFESRWQDNNASLYSLVKYLSGSHELAAGVGVGVVLGMALWAAWKRVEPARAAFLILGAVLTLTPNAYSWYFTWIVPFLCFFPNPAWLLLTVLQFLSYSVLIDYQAFGRWQFRPTFLTLTYAPFYALLLIHEMRRKSAASAVPLDN